MMRNPKTDNDRTTKLIEKIELFIENRTYAHIIDFDRLHYNGFITSINKETKSIILNDDVLGEIPFHIRHITVQYADKNKRGRKWKQSQN